MPKPTEKRGRPPLPADTESFPGKVGAAIRARRTALGLTVAQCAAAADVPVQTWYGWESKSFSLSSLETIARVLKCRARSLVP